MNYWNMQLHPNNLGWNKEKELLEKYQLIGLGDWEEAAQQQPNFENEMKKGDYVLIKHGGNIIALTRVIGDYYYDTKTNELRWFKRCRKVEVLDWYDEDYNYSVSSRKTLERCKNTETDTFKSILNWISLINNRENMKNNVTLLVHNHNLILTGAPGTGKTYLAKQIAQQMIFGEVKKEMSPEKEKQFNEQCGFVQFHPSYDYTDFVEGLRPKQDAGGNVGFERKDGVFKEFCKKSLTIEACYFDLLRDISNSENFTLKQKEGKDTTALSVDDEKRIRWFERSNSTQIASNSVSLDNLKILYKKYNTFEKLNNINDINKEIRKTIDGAANTTYYWAVLNELLRRIMGKKHVFIIDEINRGEISKIFGELFFSIDPGYRGEKGKVKTQYQNLIEEGDEFYDGFYVPENVYIIGTMNDIDRSVESMDFAFRRRFAFKEITAKDSQAMLDSKEAWGKDKMPKPDFVQKVKDKMDAINKVIFDEEKKEGIEGLSAAYHIGASYFLKLANYRNVNGEYVDTSFTDLWENHLEGLLFEYMRGMVDVPKKMKRLAEAFGYSNLAKYE